MSWMSETYSELISIGYSDEQISEMPFEKAWELAINTRTENEIWKASQNA